MGKKVSSGDLRVVGFKVIYFPPNFSLNTFLLLKLSLTHSTFTIRNKNTCNALKSVFRQANFL